MVKSSASKTKRPTIKGLQESLVKITAMYHDAESDLYAYTSNQIDLPFGYKLIKPERA